MKKLLIALTLGAALAGAAGFGAWTWAQAEARERWQSVLDRSPLGRDVIYGEVSYDPFGKALTVRDIVVPTLQFDSLYRLDPRIAELRLEGIEPDGRIARRQSVSVRGLRLDLLQSGRWLAQESPRAVRFDDDPTGMLATPLSALIALGYHEVSIDLDATMTYDPGDKTMQLDWRLAGADMGDISSSLQLERVEPRLVEKIELYQAAMVRTDAPVERLALLDRLVSENMPLMQTVALRSYDLSYAETDLVSRWLAYADLANLRLPGEPRDLPEISGLDLGEDHIAVARAGGFPVDTMLATRDAVRRFLEQLGSFGITLRARDGLPVSRLVSDPVAVMTEIERNDDITVRIQANGS